MSLSPSTTPRAPTKTELDELQLKWMRAVEEDPEEDEGDLEKEIAKKNKISMP